MTYFFKNVIIRKLNKSIINALSSQNISPNFHKIQNEHNSYIKLLNDIGLKINLLEPLEKFPDSIFVEDPVLIYKSNCIILNPFEESREGESNIIKKEIEKFFENIFFIDSGNIEGGDILKINNHFIIGLSNRTNQLGAENLSNLLKTLGATVSICKTPKNILHFKSECSLLDEDSILVSNKMAKLEHLKSNYNLIVLPEGEEGAANCLRINENLIIPDGFIVAEEILSKKYNVIKIKINEFSKIDAGLSCLSLRW